jgi:DNA-binding CsgD family transcriptional regulator
MLATTTRQDRHSGAGLNRGENIDTLMRRLMRETFATQWVLGMSDVVHDQIEFYRSSSKINARTALDIISQIPSPVVTGSVAVAPASIRGTNAKGCLGAAMRIDRRRSLRMALLHEKEVPHWSGSVDTIRAYLEQIASIPFAVSGDHMTPPVRRHVQPAMYILNHDYEVVFQWYAQDVASVALAHLAEPVGGHLPSFLERPVRRMTTAWDLNDVTTCAVSYTNPIPGLVLRTVPMRGPTLVSIGVLLEPYVARRTIEHTAASLRVSSREREVLYLLLDGESTADIATKLNIAESTVQDHVKRLILKTDSRNRVEMAAKILGWPAMWAERRRSLATSHR